MSSKTEVVVIGAGAAGLFAAYRLARRGLAVKVFEAASKAGGLLAWKRFGGADLEIFYHHLFVDDAFLLDALDRLGVGVRWEVTRTGFVGPTRDGIAELSAPWHALTFPYLRPALRARMVVTLARATAGWKMLGRREAELDRIPAGEWLASMGGRPVWDAFFEPLLEKKFGAETPQISAAFLLGRLGMRSGRTLRGEKLGYPEGGYRSLVEALERAITDLGGRILTSEPVESLDVQRGRICGVQTARGHYPAGAVLATAPPGALTRIFERAGLGAEARMMSLLPYQRALTVLLGLERPSSRFYWVNVLHRDAPFGAVIDHSNFMPAAPYGGPIVYLAAYPDPDAPVWQWSDERVVEAFWRHMQRVLPANRDNALRASHVVRAREASLIYRCGVRDLLPERRAESVDGLYYAGIFRCYPRRKVDLAGADACATADLVARELAGTRGGPQPSELPRTLDP